MRGQTRTATRRPPASSRVAITTTTTSPRPSPSASDDSEGGASPAQRPAKRRKTASSSGSKLEAYRAVLRLASLGSEAAPPPPSLPPARRHSLAYHAPLLLCGARGAAARADFLAWFDSVSGARAMPWRKPWVDPSRFSSSSSSSPSSPSPGLRAALEKRAYEVWISEIMLQQTRVAVVVEYWNRWMARWPTIRDLAGASPDDVLAAWRGLGYYSRATRIHEAARLVVGDAAMDGLLPSSARDLADRIPGVGPYTAGAISCIAFGRPAPMVDGNVLRVLSRQLGLFGSVKTDKAVVDAIWAAAEALVDAVALDGVHPQQQQQQQQDDGDGKAVAPAPGDTRSDRPGRWGQALMELGSTVCTPKPNCGECPITSTCRAYGEGLALSKRKTQQQQQQRSNNVAVAEPVADDMEDLCSLCGPFDEHCAADDDDNDEEGTEKKPAAAAAAPKGGKQAKLSAFFSKPTTSKPTTTAAAAAAHSKADIEVIVRHARRFPVKTAKKAVREEETLVCAVVRADGRYLLRKRPAKGLLAGLWEFPSSSPALLLQETKKSKAASAKTTTTTTTTTTTAGRRRAKLAREFVAATLGLPPGRDRDSGEDEEDEDSPSLEYVGELGSVPWLFSHIKLTMHVHLFRLRGTTSDDVGVGVDVGDGDGATSGRWSDSVETESMGTGMRRCWDLVKQAV